MRASKTLQETIKETWYKVPFEQRAQHALNYQTGNFPGSDKVKDIKTRFYFDTFYALQDINAKIRDYVHKENLNDNHIMTLMGIILPDCIEETK